MIEGVVAAPVAAVWSAWTTADGLLRVQYQAPGRLGDAGTIENRILAFEPQRTLALRVAGFAWRQRVGEMWTVLSVGPTAEGQTRLRITSPGLADDDEAQRLRACFDKGNRYTLGLLQKRFPPWAHGPGRHRPGASTPTGKSGAAMARAGALHHQGLLGCLPLECGETSGNRLCNLRGLSVV